MESGLEQFHCNTYPATHSLKMYLLIKSDTDIEEQEMVKLWCIEKLW